MCQATVYMVEEGEETEIMRDVILLEPAEEGVSLHAFFDEPIKIPARVERIGFLKHTVTLAPMEEPNHGNDGRR